MKNQIKDIFCKKFFVFVILTILLIGGIFYWFAYRPARIRHDCSWVHKHQSASMGGLIGRMQQTTSSPEKDWWDPASTKQYSFCIHEKGL